jgi:glycosyltransferase involved in cell wall biosynthesis
MVDGFAEAMTKLMSSPELAKSIGAAGRKRAIRDFDWQKKIQQVISIYQALEDRTVELRESGGGPVSSPAISEQQ